MAAVLDAMVPYVKNLITDITEQEVSMLLGVSGEITKLEENMESLKAFVTDAENRRLTDQSVQRWVRKLKDAMYDATDILDICQLEAAKRRESKSGRTEQKMPTGCFQPLLFCLRNPTFAHKIGTRIKELNQRLEGIHKEADRFKFNIGLGSSLEPRMPTAAERSSQRMTSEFDELAIVGEKIERETRELAHLLITSVNHEVKVVSIVGTGGMGKTTLAQKIFNDTTNIFNGTTMQEHFKVKIWLSITQHFDEAELLRTAIMHAGGHYDGEQDKTLLTRTLTETLSKSRFLLVLDDVWSDDAWKNVLCVPVRKANQEQAVGNWVLITTRLEDMAQRMGCSFYQHHVSPINEEDAWSLLNKQLPPPTNQVTRTDHLKDIGMRIIGKCGGLPLAIKVIGGLLSTRPQSEHEWEAILNHHAWSTAGLPKELDNRIYLSYDNLSPQLKQCFLYCSLFPKGASILQGVVTSMWISEGFIQPQDGRNSSYDDRLEEIAIECYHELINRNLLDPADSTITKYSCIMHDVVRSFAEFMAKEDSLVVQDRQVTCMNKGSIIRRMSIGGPTKLVPEWAILQETASSLRTLIIDCEINFKAEEGDLLSSFSRLRALYIKGAANCGTFFDSLYQLSHLRYLRLENTDIPRLPDNIHMMKFLQFIVLRNCRSLEHLPSSIIKLVQLRSFTLAGSNDNLTVTGSNEKVTIPRGFGGLTNLRLLYGFPVHMDNDGDGAWCSLQEIGPLSHLRNLALVGLQNLAASSLAEMAMIRSKKHLEYFQLHWSSSGFMGWSDEILKQQQQQVAEEVFEKLYPPSSIRHLIITGYYGCQLPNWMMVHATWEYKSLRVLMLQDLPSCNQLPNGLCQLPSLESLSIVDAPAIKSVGPDFQSPSSLAVGGGITTTRSTTAFPNLTTLYLRGLSEWEQWDWEESAKDKTADSIAMTALSKLEIKICKLRYLPPGLASSKRIALRRLKLYELTNLRSLENFPSVVELEVFDCPELKRISNLFMLQKIRTIRCPNVLVLEGVPVLDSMTLEDATMETLPEYLTTVNPRHLVLGCGKKLQESLSTDSFERTKIRHIGKHNIYCMSA